MRNVLFLPKAPSPKPQASSWLLDAAGRRVLALRPGPNDLRRLPAGIYFVRGASGVGREASGITKVILAR